jgi:phenolic acid decarboxylase
VSEKRRFVAVCIRLIHTMDCPGRQLHGVIFFPHWVAQDSKKTVCFQNQHLDLMRQYRDAGPTYPKLVIDEFAPVTFLEDCASADNGSGATADPRGAIEFRSPGKRHPRQLLAAIVPSTNSYDAAGWRHASEHLLR